MTSAGGELNYNRKKRKDTVEAKDEATAKKIIQALAASGFHAKTDHEKVKFKDVSQTVDKEVTNLKVGDAHLCCRACVNYVNRALRAVKGVIKTNARMDGTGFTIYGKFNGAEAIKALNKAGFHVSLAK